VKITEEGPEQVYFNADDRAGPQDEDGFSQDGTSAQETPDEMVAATRGDEDVNLVRDLV
jgi:hypothetical protein